MLQLLAITIDYGETSSDGVGATGQMKMVYAIIKRQDLRSVVRIIRQFHPIAFYSVDKVKSVQRVCFPKNGRRVPVFFRGLAPSVFTGKENKQTGKILCHFVIL